MEKYGTYRIFKNKETEEIVRKPISQEDNELEKIASNEKWIELDYEPDTAHQPE